VLLSILQTADANGQDDSGQRRYFGKSHAKADIVGLLIDHGADVMVMDETKSTPLHLASAVGSVETVRLLIEHGADVTAQGVNNRTPLHLASCRVSTKTVRR
jgi:ankyrin repeat protein